MIPKVTIGMPVFNGARYVATAVESLLAQTFGDFELIISDNASTDDTEKICRKLADADPRIVLHRHRTNRGAAENYNFVVNVARGRYFKWATHDDMCAPTFLEECVKVLDGADRDVVLCSPRTKLIDASGTEIKLYEHDVEFRHHRPYRRVAALARHLKMCNCLCGVMRTEVLRSTRLIGRYPGSDVVLLTELALRGQCWQVPEALFYRRIHEEMSCKRNARTSDVALWFDPRCLHWSYRFGATRRMVEQFRAVRQAHLPIHETVLSLSALVACRAERTLRVQIGAKRRRLSQVLGRYRPSSGLASAT